MKTRMTTWRRSREDRVMHQHVDLHARTQANAFTIEMFSTLPVWLNADCFGPVT
jgi:hypothetical protein